MNVLAIGAHFDDIELGCSGALARHRAKGDNVYAYVVTHSGYKDQNGEWVRNPEIALSEGEQAMNILGVKLIKGSFNTLEVEFTDDLNKELLKIIQDYNIHFIYTHWTGDAHHDHQAVARATLHCGRHVSRILMYRSNWYTSQTEFKGNFYVDISDFWDVKEKSIRAHGTEVERTDFKWINYFRNEAANAGMRVGVEYAEQFEVVKWLEL